MNQRIRFVIDFLFDSNERLLLKMTASYKQQEINLSLSSFMIFLSENGSQLASDDLDFCYSLNKLFKKVNFNNQVIRAIIDDSAMAGFFAMADKCNIDLFWEGAGGQPLLSWTDVIPLTIKVDVHNGGAVCKLLERDEWLSNPISWILFQAPKNTYIFSKGTIIRNPSTELLDFLDDFYDVSNKKISSENLNNFINNIHKRHKDQINWLISDELKNNIPQDSAPFPVLTVTENKGTLVPNLSYQYGTEIVFPDDKEEIIKDQKTGVSMNRMRDMEAIYQQDLMDLFLENKIPFMLSSPKDIVSFLDNMVPVLTERDWIIESDVPEYKIINEPAEIEFNIRQADSGINWFEFEQDCEINGETFNLSELARLMIDNQGYVKTGSGYVKIDDNSQKEISSLSKLGAFRRNKKFTKADILPMVSAAQINGQDQSSVDFIKNINQMESCSINASPSERFTGELRDYQQYGLNWLNFLYTAGLGGVLADDMGLGKTVQTIAFVDQLEQKGPCLVIGPTSVVYNWVKEIEKFVPHRKVIAYTGQNRHNHLDKLEDADFVISSFGVVKNDVEWFQAINFKAIFVDEAQYIKNPKTQISKAIKSINASFKIAMTGTPIENHLQDLWNLMDFVIPGYLGTKRVFELHISDGNNEFLKTKIKPFILRREKKEVLLSLPEKTEIILKCGMTDQQKTLYETVLQAARSGIKGAKGKNQKLSILTTLLKLRQICIHPGLLKETRGQSIPSAKFDLAKEKIEELIDEGHKIVLFTQFTTMIDILHEWASEKEINLYRIDGSVSSKKRMDIVDDFQNSKGSGLFTISLKAGGVGINLTAADYVIHLDPWWNPAVESQATDRVHRMGQKNKVIVYKFITEGTIEEKIQELQEQKKQLLSEIIEVDNLEEKNINFDEIKSLLF